MDFPNRSFMEILRSNCKNESNNIDGDHKVRTIMLYKY